MSKRIAVGFTAMLAAFSLGGVASAGKIVNGNFEDGNTGFSTQYANVSEFCGDTGLYAIANDPAPLNCFGFWPHVGDHTTGSGLMLVATGATEPDTIVWSETVKAVPNTTYVLTFWGTTLNTYDGNSPPFIQANFNGAPVGQSLRLPGAYDGKWHAGRVVWKSRSAKSATISLIDTQPSGANNDFALDDIKLKAKSH